MSRVTTLTILAGLLAGLALGCGSSNPPGAVGRGGDGPADEMKRLEGTWVAESATRDGKPADDWKESQLVFASDKVTFKGPKGKDETFIYKFEPLNKPKTINFAREKKDS